MAEYLHIPVDRIRCDQQVRRTFNEESIGGLAQSLKEVGMLHPVLVMADGDGYYRLVSGERRLRAAVKAGERVVPALVVRQPRGSITQIQLIENLQREDLNPVERALAIRSFMEQEGLSKAAAAARLGVPRTTLTDWLDVLELDPRYQAALVDNFSGGDSPLTLSHVSEARALAARLGSPAIANLLLDAVLEHRLSKAETRQVAQLVREHANLSIQQAVRMVRMAQGAAARRARQAAGDDAAGQVAAAAEPGAPGAEGGAGTSRAGRFEAIIRSLDRVRQALAALVGGALSETTPPERQRLLEYLQSLRRWIDDAIAFTREMDDPALAEQRRRAMALALKKASRRRRREARRLLSLSAPAAPDGAGSSSGGSPAS
ncbi:MAG TPA: ParB/RepB/Spo0J family partition protein [Limnochordales bacterium]